jgi:hypothetical protein
MKIKGLTANEYCPTAGAISEQHIRAGTHEPLSRQRLAVTGDGEVDRIRPRQKKEKN